MTSHHAELERHIDSLIRRGMKIPDREGALEFVRHTGVDVLREYLPPFCKRGGDEFVAGAAFDDVVKLFAFDADFRVKSHLCACYISRHRSDHFKRRKIMSLKITHHQQQTLEDMEKMQQFASKPHKFIAEGKDAAEELVQLYQKIIPPLVLIYPRQDDHQSMRSAPAVALRACEDACKHEMKEPERLAVGSRLQEALAQTRENLGVVIAMSEALSVRVPATEAQAQDALKKAKKLLSDADANMKAAEQQAKQRRAEIDKETSQILADAKGVSLLVGVSAQARFFKVQARMHNKGRLWWLKASAWAGGILVAALVAALFASFFFKNNDLQFVVTKALLFSTLAYALFFCVKNYMAHRHNYVVNKHRQNALMTYRAIASGAQSDGTARDIILAQAAHCIFAPQSTGYAKGDGGGDAMRFIPMEAVKDGIESATKK